LTKFTEVTHNELRRKAAMYMYDYREDPVGILTGMIRTFRVDFPQGGNGYI